MIRVSEIHRYLKHTLFRAPSEHDQQPQIFMYNTQLSESLDESSM